MKHFTVKRAKNYLHLLVSLKRIHLDKLALYWPLTSTWYNNIANILIAEICL